MALTLSAVTTGLSNHESEMIVVSSGSSHGFLQAYAREVYESFTQQCTAVASTAGNQNQKTGRCLFTGG